MNEEKEVKTRPIIFTGDSVPKIIEGRKTMTRRVAKKLPWFGPSFHELNYERHPFSPSALNVCEDINIPLDPILERMSWVGYDWCGNAIGVEEVDFLKCPYGLPGDFLYVKEGFVVDNETCDHEYCSGCDIGSTLYLGEGWCDVQYLASPLRLNPPSVNYELENDSSMIHGQWFDEGSACGEKERWVFVPSRYYTKYSPLFMPKWASRILLKVESVGLQLLQQIDEKDAKREGYDSKDSFRRGWDSINSKRGFGWEDNAWVWVIGFSVVSIKKAA